VSAVAEKKIKNYDLIVQAKEGSEDAMGKLLKEYHKMIYREVCRFTKDKDKQDDLYQIGALALIEAVDRFDLSTGNEFSTYVFMQIKGRIMVNMRDNRTLKFPRPMVELGLKIKKYDLAKKDIEYICEYLNETEDKVMDALLFIDREYALSTSATIDSGKSNNKDTITIGDSLIKDANGEQWENAIMLRSYIERLPKEERAVINAMYIEDKQRIDVSKEMGTNPTNISRIEQRALANLRRLINGEEVVYKKETRGASANNAKGNQTLAKELVRKGELKQIEIANLTGVSTGTIGYWARKIRNGKKI